MTKRKRNRRTTNERDSWSQFDALAQQAKLSRQLMNADQHSRAMSEAQTTLFASEMLGVAVRAGIDFKIW